MPSRTSGSASSGLVATGSSFTSATVTTPAAGPSALVPAIVVHISLKSTIATVLSISTTGLGGAAGTLVKAVRNGDCYSCVWEINNPTASTTGTFTVNLSASVPYQYSWAVFSGTDAVAPCPMADAVTASGTGTGGGSVDFSLTPTNMTGTDCSSGVSALTVAGNLLGVSAGTQRYQDTTTTVNMQSGDNVIGTLGGRLDLSQDGASGQLATGVIARITDVSTGGGGGANTATTDWWKA